MSSPVRGVGVLGPRELTPILTEHARERCAEMGISTKVAKRIWQQRAVVRGLDEQNRVVVTSTAEPLYAAVIDPTGQVPVVVTVLFVAEHRAHERAGTTYRIVEEGRS